MARAHICFPRRTRILKLKLATLSGHFASRATCGGFYANLIGKCHNSWHLVGCANFPPRSSNPVGCAILCFEGLRPSRSPASLWRPLFLFRLRLHKNSASTRTAPWREPHSKGLRPSRSPASLWRPLFLFRLRLHKNSASTRTAPWREHIFVFHAEPEF